LIRVVNLLFSSFLRSFGISRNDTSNHQKVQELLGAFIYH